MNWGVKAADLMVAVREKKPLVHHITNFVVMNETANITLACGALPVMAHAKEEAAEMAGQASVLVLNIGTLWPDEVEAMKLAGHRANERGIPVVLDPVGAGATAYRTRVSRELLDELKISLVRGNVAEIGVLAGLDAEIAGVEAAGGPGGEKEAAVAFVGKYGCAAAVTGPVDVVAAPGIVLVIANGHKMMGTVTGTGCMATTVLAAFAAVNDNMAEAAAAGLAVYGLAGQIAAGEAKGPGTFHVLLYDAMANLTEDEIRAGAKIDEI
ncbi:MAG: hydroxyethylthiazole kinase [Actinomycetota bacterium]